MGSVCSALGLFVVMPAVADGWPGVDLMASIADADVAAWLAVSVLSVLHPNQPPNGRFLGLLVERTFCEACDQVVTYPIGHARPARCRVCGADVAGDAWTGRVMRWLRRTIVP